MSAVDFHQVLGVTPDASAAEIKRAYKRLAMRWHPDRNPDPRAHDQFRLVREAFERLTQPSKTPPPTTPPPKRRPQKAAGTRPRGADHRQDITVDLTEAARGTTVTVTIDGREPCDDCDGSGQRSYGRTSMCGSCHGSGRLRRNGQLETCGDCGGKGFTTDNRCPSCEGRGWQPADRQLAVTVPPPCCPAKSSASPARAARRPTAATRATSTSPCAPALTRSSGCSTTTSTWRCR
jgi:molecular chaperone DnaJ